METTVRTMQELKDVLKRISFARSCIDFGWGFEVEEILVETARRNTSACLGWFVNTTFKRPDTHTGEIGIGKGRKEFIAVGTSESGVVKTAWVLVRMIVEHELMESFLVDNKRIFDPHAPLEVLQYGKAVCEHARPITQS